MAVSFADFRKAIKDQASKQGLGVASWPRAPHILEISTAPSPTVLYVKISNIGKLFWGLNEHRIDSLRKKADGKWRVVLLKGIDSGYMLPGDEVMQQIANGKFGPSTKCEYKVHEKDCKSSWEFQGLDALIRTGVAGLHDIESAIGELERRISGDLNQIATGEAIIRGLGSKEGLPYNTIPSDIKGPCYPLLITAIGSEDDVESRILQAARHVEDACAGITRTVIFLAAKWDAGAWIRNRHHFAETETYLHLFFMQTVRLT